MQIIVFTLSEKYYAISTDNVDEISNKIPATIVPNAPDWVEGLINLRGNVVTLVNLCKLLQQCDDKCYNNIIILNNATEKIGILVKDVFEVTNINNDDIQRISDEVSDYLMGIVRIEGNIVNIVDLDKLIQ